jgi:hypothetical protein
MIERLLLALLAVSPFAEGALLNASSSSSVDETGYDFAQKTVKANAVSLGISDPLSYSATATACVGSFGNEEETALYTMVFFPTAQEFKISSLIYHIGTEKDDNGQFLDTIGKIEFTEGEVTVSGVYDGVFGRFVQYAFSDSVSADFVSAKEVGFFRINVHAVSYTDDGLEKDEIAMRRNFQGCQTIVNFSTGEIGQIYDRVIIVGDHTEAFQLFDIGANFLGDQEVEQLHYSCFSFDYDDYESLGQLQRLEVSYDKERYKGTTNLTGFAAINFNVFLDGFDGLSTMRKLEYDEKISDVQTVISAEPVSISYHYGFWDGWFTEGTFETSTIQKISDLEEDGYDLSDEAKEYQFAVVFDTETAFVESFSVIPYNYFYIYDGVPSATVSSDGCFAEITNFSYIRFWFKKDGEVIEYKAFDDKVKDSTGNSDIVDISSDWEKLLEILAEVWNWIQNNLLYFLVGAGVFALAGFIVYNRYRNRN